MGHARHRTAYQERVFLPICFESFYATSPNTLQIVKDIGKGKTPIGATASASARAPKVKKVKVDIPREENPSLYEICLCTRQSLESHIKLDRKENVEMMIEINLLHNYAHQALLYEKE